MAKMLPMIAGREFVKALWDKGLIPERCQRVVIDATHDHVLLHYSVYADTRLIEALQDPAVRVEEKEP